MGLRTTAVLRIDGKDITDSLGSDHWESLAIADIQITYGHEFLVEHSDTGDATITILARPHAADILRDPLNRSVQIRFYVHNGDGTGLGGTVFRGKITDGTLDYHPLPSGEPAFLATLTASGRLAEAERIKIADEGVRKSEPLPDRLKYLASKLAPLGLDTPTDAGWNFSEKIAGRDYEGTSVLDALKELMNTAGEQLAYSPPNDHIMGDPIYNATLAENRLVLEWLDDKVAILPGEDAEAYARVIMADEAEMTSAPLSQYRAMSAVAAKGYWRTNKDGKPVFDDRLSVVDYLTPDRDGMRFELDGLGFKRWPEDEDVSLGKSYDRASGLGATMRLFQHPPVTRAFPDGFKDWITARIALAAEPYRASFYIMGSVFGALGDMSQFCRPIGGEITYAPGPDGVPRWESTQNMSTIRILGDLETITLGEMNPSATQVETRRNSALNPSPQRTDGDYYPYGAGVTGERVVGHSPGGSAFYRLDFTAGHTRGNKGRYHDVLQPAAKGETWTLSIYVRPSVTMTMAARGEFRDATTAIGAYKNGPATNCPAGKWTRLHVTITAEGAATLIRHQTYLSDSVPAGTTLDIDAELVEQNGSPTAYFSGDSSKIGYAYGWDGYQGSSQSVEYATSGQFAYEDLHPSMNLLDLAQIERGL